MATRMGVAGFLVLQRSSGNGIYGGCSYEGGCISAGAFTGSKTVTLLQN